MVIGLTFLLNVTLHQYFPLQIYDHWEVPWCAIAVSSRSSLASIFYVWAFTVGSFLLGRGRVAIGLFFLSSAEQQSTGAAINYTASTPFVFLSLG